MHRSTDGHIGLSEWFFRRSRSENSRHENKKAVAICLFIQYDK